MTKTSRGAELGSKLRGVILSAKKEKRVWYSIIGIIAFMIMMVNRAITTSFVMAARIIMTVAYLHRTVYAYSV